MKHRLNHLIRSAAAALVTAALVAGNGILSPALAQGSQSPFSLSVSPSTAFFAVKPGESRMHSVQLRNKGAGPVTVMPKLVDFSADGISGTPILKNESTFPYLANAKDVLSPITIQPGQQATIPFVIKPDEKALQQEYHLTILFEQQPSLVANTSSVVPTVGSNLVVLISGEAPKPLLKVISLQTFKVIDSFRPLVFKPLAENQGNAAGIASGSATVKDWRGRTIASFPLYPDVVLSQTTRELRAAKPAAPVLPDDPKAEIATKLQPTAFSIKQFMFLGPYRIEFAITDPASPDTAATLQAFTLFALPISAVIAVAGTAGVLIAVRYFRHRMRRQPLQPPQDV